MAKQFFLFKWVHGWRLDKFFNTLFQHSENGNISVKDAAAKVIDVIDQVLTLSNGSEAAIIEAAISEEGQVTIEQVKTELGAIKEALSLIDTLPDVATALKDFKFSPDANHNDFYHSLVSTAAIAFNDGKISLFEAISFAAQVALFIKDNK